MKVFVVGSMYNYANFLEDVSLVNNIEEAEVVLFTGGEDVTPALYNCQAHPSTYNNPTRDHKEKEIFEKVNPDKQVCLGICRGSQFLCVMNGGILVQNCTRHAIGHTHGITDGNIVYQITSTHHQMQYPFNLDKDDYTILYKSYNNNSTRYEGDKIEAHLLLRYGEPEIVLYHKKGLPKCLAVQGHPEMIPNSPVAKMINQLVKQLVNEIK